MATDSVTQENTDSIDWYHPETGRYGMTLGGEEIAGVRLEQIREDYWLETIELAGGDVMHIRFALRAGGLEVSRQITQR